MQSQDYMPFALFIISCLNREYDEAKHRKRLCNIEIENYIRIRTHPILCNEIKELNVLAVGNSLAVFINRS